MNAKYLAVVAALAVMLVAATAFATTDSVFAGGHGHKKKGGYEKSQAVSQVNNCGNGKYPENVWCQNSASQIQGDYNDARLSSAQGSGSGDGGYDDGSGASESSSSSSSSGVGEGSSSSGGSTDGY